MEMKTQTSIAVQPVSISHGWAHIKYLKLNEAPQALKLRIRGAQRRSATLQASSSSLLEATTSAAESPFPRDSFLPQSVPDMWAQLVDKYADMPAMSDPHHTPSRSYTYREAADSIRQFASGVQSLGVGQGEVVSLFSENSSRWLLADQGLMMAGAADAVRGVSSSAEELGYILRHSGSRGLVVQDAATLEKLLPVLVGEDKMEGSGLQGPVAAALRFVVVLWGEPSPEAVQKLSSCPVLSFQQLMDRGAAAAAEFQPATLTGDDLATLVYTSGTTGSPKGVALTHSNLLYQANNFDFFLGVQPGNRTLSLLPPWHIYERAVGYYLYRCGAHQVYSNIRKFREDLGTYPPDFFVCVPLVLDTLHTRVKATLRKASAVRRALATSLLAAAAARVRAQRVVEGVDLAFAREPRPLGALVKAWLMAQLLAPLNWLAQRLVVSKVRAALGISTCVVSGGGSLAGHLDDFYESIGLPVLNGWGLTETSPVLACRRNLPGRNVRGSVGYPIPGTQLRVVAPDSLQDLPPGKQGLVLARGPGVMRGYFNDEAATAKAFRAGEGWFDTGDLGWRAPEGVAGSNMAGVVVLTGRAKDTIVLSSGENVEPQPIEDALCCSPIIKFAVLVGSGRRGLGALIVTDEDALKEAAAQQGVEALPDTEVRSLVRREVSGATAGRIRFEQVVDFEVLKDPFSVDDGTLTRTMKPRRPAIMQKYAQQVAALERKLR